MFKFKKIAAFTLAETLMVIGILGIVSAITIPNLRNDSNYQVNVSKAKKTYAELSTAWDRAMLNNPIVNGSNLGAKDVAAKMRKYLKVKAINSVYAINTDNTDCKDTATLLSDGATFCVQNRTTGNVPAFNIYFDIDGQNKGANSRGEDLFVVNVAFRPGILNPPSIEPILFNINNDTTTIMEIPFSRETGAMYWILLYDNMEYLKCEVQWNTQTTCK